MSEPRYVEDIFKRMFLWMSIGWIAIGLIMGFLGLIGVLKPMAHSMNQDSTEITNFILFIVLGIIFFIAHSVQRSTASRKKK